MKLSVISTLQKAKLKHICTYVSRYLIRNCSTEMFYRLNLYFNFYIYFVLILVSYNNLISLVQNCIVYLML